ncbi:MAG: adenylate/guanylate cyclase domain-containing protein [Bacteroidetes bacterium]|nr:adenylate/guanylate cyclase domain-containing protein [Bacteroidota bacterium]
MTILIIISLFIIMIAIGQSETWNELNLFACPVDDEHGTSKEEKRIFCFIDLKGSTTIAEELGHLKFSKFLQDYYSDITLAIKNTEAEIYQYVGDEIVLSWPYAKGLKNNNSIQCFYEMKAIIASLSGKYMRKYGVCPEFKAGLHGGNVMSAEIGKIKKEAVYIGDVLNTTARIVGNCNRLGKEFLISGKLIRELNIIEGFESLFIEATIPRGKKTQVDLYSLRKIA